MGGWSFFEGHINYIEVCINYFDPRILSTFE